MDPVKLAKLQAAARNAANGAPRRKKIHRKPGQDEDNKIKANLKKLNAVVVPEIQDANMIMENGTVVTFKNPTVQAAVQSNTFAINGTTETKSIVEMVALNPTILNQLGPESLVHLRKAAGKDEAPMAMEEDIDDIPELVGSFDEASKNEA
ncbi:hypothetical protein L596_020223 [Steinernema carpocapsae]|uniref:Transcription factor BTF3 n=1 Tax=Steinernema carpocapsae TaxID=34508 RepID=A0A4U5MT33_STECR|nr:hypothetical protein L596_020223 [Steinernema carpocapsae]